jgi:hypothetical protein
LHDHKIALHDRTLQIADDRMFLLDSLMIDGISWVLKTVVTAADAEMNDDTALREQLLAAEMQREMGEISDAHFVDLERDLLARIRDIKERREGGSGPLEFGAGQPIEAEGGSRLQIEATVSGDFHEPAAAPHTVVVETPESHRGIIATASGQTEQVIDIEPPVAQTADAQALPLPARSRSRTNAGTTRAAQTTRTTRRIRTARTTPARSTIRTTRTTSRSPRPGKIR